MAAAALALVKPNKAPSDYFSPFMEPAVGRREQN